LKSSSRENESVDMVKAVILAAGRGERLLPLTQNSPKPLLKILNKPLLEHTLNMLKHEGIGCCIIVTGYKAKAIREFIGDGSKYNIKIQYSYNPVYDNGNATSLRTAQTLLKSDEVFLLIMSDHLIDKAIIQKALENSDRAPLLCVDRKPHYSFKIEDSTKVLVNSKGFIVDIGKEIPSWNAIDTGVFLLNGKIFQIIEQLETEKAPFPLTLNRCLKRMIAAGMPLWACDVSGNLWLDIDTVEDLIFAERLLGGFLSV
jgi:choline kinase